MKFIDCAKCAVGRHWVVFVFVVAVGCVFVAAKFGLSIFVDVVSNVGYQLVPTVAAVFITEFFIALDFSFKNLFSK